MKFVLPILLTLLLTACTHTSPTTEGGPLGLSPPTAAPTGVLTTLDPPSPTPASTIPPLALAPTRAPAVTSPPLAPTTAATAPPGGHRVFLPGLPQRAEPAPTPTPRGGPAHVDPLAADCAGLIVARDGRFLKDGRPWTFLGTNVSYLPALPFHAVEATLDFLVDHNVGVVRTWVMPHHDLDYVEQVLDAGRKRGLYWLLAFDDFYANPRDTAWWGEGFRQTYLPHVERVVRRFGDRPDVFMWQLMNEPTCGPEGVSDECLKRMRSWARDTTAVLRGLDTCRPLAVGLIGMGGNLPREESHFKMLHGIRGIDAMSLHRHAFEDFREKLKREMGIAADKELPLVWSEVYEKAYDKGCQPLSDDALRKRADLIRRDLERTFKAGVDGYLLWQFAYGTLDHGNGRLDNHCGEFDYERDDPVWQVFKRFRLPTTPGG